MDETILFLSVGGFSVLIFIMVLKSKFEDRNIVGYNTTHDFIEPAIILFGNLVVTI